MFNKSKGIINVLVRFSVKGCVVQRFLEGSPPASVLKAFHHGTEGVVLLHSRERGEKKKAGKRTGTDLLCRQSTATQARDQKHAGDTRRFLDLSMATKWRPYCVEFACPPHVCVGSPHCPKAMQISLNCP